MKIIIIQERGRHKKNREFREALNFHRAFKKIGQESIVWGLNYPNFETNLKSIIEQDDIIFLLENYEVGNWIPNLKQFKNLKIFWSIDSHCNLQQNQRTCSKHGINIVLNAIESDQKRFKQKTYWFPNAYPHDLIDYRSDIPETVDIGFCGNLLNRANYIKKLKRDYNLKPKIMVLGDDMVKEINSYKIHFNKNISNDINYRTFETLGCKTCLVTNHTENLEKLFDICDEIGKSGHLITYSGYNDLRYKIGWLLSDDKARNSIAEAGYEYVRRKHTFIKRAKKLLSIIGENQ